MAKTTKNILSLNHDDAMDFFMKSERYHSFELPEYFTFDEALKYMRETIGNAPYEECVPLKSVDCSHYAFRIICRIIDSLKDMDKKHSFIDLGYHKLYNQLRLQNMTYPRTINKIHPHTPLATVNLLPARELNYYGITIS